MATFYSNVKAVCKRKKRVDAAIMVTDLSRCLTTFDLTFLAIGHMVGAGLYVVIGTVAEHVAGPATVLSYLMAGLAALISALCYAEFGARVPKAGSAYSYTYITIGEPLAFVVGWNMIMEFALCCASVARALGGTVDVMTNHAIQNWTVAHLGRIHFLGIENTYPDLVGCATILVVMVLLVTGAKASLRFNNIFTTINCACIVLIIGVGLAYVDPDNWEGGFAPFGFSGIFTGASICFFSFIGFEGIAVAGEETETPTTSIPIAIAISMATVTIMYCACAITLTLLVPYDTIDVSAPFPAAFANNNVTWAKYLVAVGSLIGMFTCILANAFGIPRQVYAMANDGLIFRFLAYIEPRTQTPLVAIFITGPMTAILTLLLNLPTLAEFLSIGTLLSYSIVDICVLLLRYKPASECPFELCLSQDSNDENEVNEMRVARCDQKEEDIGQLRLPFRKMALLKEWEAGRATKLLTVAMAFCMMMLAGVISVVILQESVLTWWILFLMALTLTGTLAALGLLALYEPNTSFKTFQVPLVPLLPALGLFLNLLLMMQLSWLSWIRLAIWLLIGLIIYVFYGIRHSDENRPLGGTEHGVVGTYCSFDETAGTVEQ